MNSKKHLNYDELLSLYKYIYLSYPCKMICSIMHKSRSTIYRILINNSEPSFDGRTAKFSNKYRNCAKLKTCKQAGVKSCEFNCPNYVKWVCPKLKKFPYICNFCLQRQTCGKEKRIFNPEQAYYLRKDRLSESKSSPKVSQEDIVKFDSFFSPLVKQGLSVEIVCESFKNETPVTSRTARNWIDKKYLSVGRMDLRNAVKREYNPDYASKRKISKDPLRKVGRTMSSYCSFMNNHDERDVRQFDTVHGKKKDKQCVLTIHSPSHQFQIGILLSSCTAMEVQKKLDEFKTKLGTDNFYKLFRIILCDNGSEFDSMPDLEIDKETKEQRIHVFYTRPYCSGDKGSCERNHELFRYVIAKGKSLDDLTQDELNFIFSNINSYPRKSLGYQTPYDVFTEDFGTELVTKLGIHKIPFKELTFKKKLK